MQVGTKKAIRIIVFGIGVLGVIASAGVLLSGQSNSASSRLPRKSNPAGWRTGQIVIKPQFDYLSRFKGGLALVHIRDKYGYIDKTGRYIINPRFDDARDFEDGLAAVGIGDKWGYIDKTGQFVINPQFSSVWGFTDGLAPVFIGDRKTGKWGYIAR